MKRSLILVTLFSLLLLGSTLPAQAATFKTCKDMQKVYKYGISQSATASNKGAGPIHPARVSASLYLKNKKLDTDRDGIACEVIKKAETAFPSTAPTPTAAPIPVRVISTVGQEVSTPSGLQVRVVNISRSITSPGNEQILLKYVIKNPSATSLREQTFRMVDEKGVSYPPLNFGTFETLLLPSGVELERSLVWQRTPVGSKLVAEIDRALDSKGGILKFGASFEVEALANKPIAPVTNLRVSKTATGAYMVEWSPPTTYADGTPLTEQIESFYAEYTIVGQQTQRLFPEEGRLLIFDRRNSIEGVAVEISTTTRQSFSAPMKFSIFNGQIILTP